MVTKSQRHTQAGFNFSIWKDGLKNELWTNCLQIIWINSHLFKNCLQTSRKYESSERSIILQLLRQSASLLLLFEPPSFGRFLCNPVENQFESTFSLWRHNKEPFKLGRDTWKQLGTRRVWRRETGSRPLIILTEPRLKSSAPPLFDLALTRTRMTIIHADVLQPQPCPAETHTHSAICSKPAWI